MKEYVRAIVVYLLTLEAKAVLRKYKPRIIAITGSVGKTSSKDAAYAAISGHTFVRKSEKSFNSDIGVPLTVLGVPNGWGSVVQWLRNLADGLLLLILPAPYPRWLIVEVGADRPGDISRALSWLQPSVVVATRFPEVPVHVEFYDSPEAVFAEESYPLTALGSGSCAVLNADDERMRTLTLPDGVSTIRYGFAKDADVRASHYRVLTARGAPRGISFSIHHADERLQVSLGGAIGKVHVYALLAGVAAARAAAVPFSRMKDIAEAYQPSPGRLRLIKGANDTTIIDDSYNASPAAVEEALNALESAPTGGRRIAVLADMLELGRYSAEEHRKAGAAAATVVDFLVTIGVRARHIAEGAKAGGMHDSAIRSFERGEDAAVFLRAELKEGDTVLVKGSQSMRMERVVRALMKDPDDAPRLLARQDTEWLSRP